MTSKLDQLRAAYEAATPGEWNGIGGTLCSLGNSASIQPGFRDNEYITLSHNMMPAILRVLESLDQFLDDDEMNLADCAMDMTKLRDSWEALKAND